MRDLALGLLLSGYVLLMWTNPVRASLRDGWRCLRRYPVLWRMLAWLAFANALFIFAARLTAHWRGEAQLIWMRPAWNVPGAGLASTPDSVWWMPQSAAHASLNDSILPGVEMLAGLFNCVVTTFPVAVFAALGFLLNRRGGLGKFRRALQRRFGVWSWLFTIAMLVCAMAALAKAVLYFWAPGGAWWAMWAPTVAALSSLFEYVFGVGVQAYLILHAYAWVRGLNFRSDAMREVALRRLGASMKWAAIVLLAQICLIELPLVLSFAMEWPTAPDAMGPYLQGARFAMTGIILAFASGQAWLALHGETLGRAWKAHWRLLRRHAWSVLWFLLVAAIHCSAVHALRAVVLRGLGEDTAPGVLWTLVWPLLFGAVAGWLLASWVCLFKRCE